MAGVAQRADKTQERGDTLRRAARTTIPSERRPRLWYVYSLLAKSLQGTHIRQTKGISVEAQRGNRTIDNPESAYDIMALRL